MEVAEVLHMNEGIGEASYAKNSLLQQKVILMTKSIRDEAITAIYRSLSPETICMADLGCSSGPNTFLVLDSLKLFMKNAKAMAKNSRRNFMFS